MNKRGISSIIATVLIIFGAVVLSTILFFGVKTLMSGLNEINTDVDLQIVTSEGYTLWDEENRLATIQVKRGDDNSDLIGFDMVFTFAGDSVKHYVTDIPGTNSKKVYAISFFEFTGSLDSVKIIPVFSDGSLGSVAVEFDVTEFYDQNILDLIDEGKLDEEDFVEPSGLSGSGSSSSSGGSSSSSSSSTTTETTCGDGVIEGSEACDYSGSELLFGSRTCKSEGALAGDLFCNDDCSLDITECIFNCETCASCDEIYDPCTYYECHDECPSEDCYYRGYSAIRDDCVNLTEACEDELDNCTDYSEEECPGDPCGFGGCYFDEDAGECVSGEASETCVPVDDPCGERVCGTVGNGTCGTVSCGTCDNGEYCDYSSGSCEVSEVADDERYIGINFHASQSDWTKDRMFADVMKTSRMWTEIYDENGSREWGSGESLSLDELDENGWPTKDCEFRVWSGIDKMDGTYYVEGYSDNNPTISSSGYGEIYSKAYDESTDKFTFLLNFTTSDGSALLLTFQNTGNGIHDMKIMRPTEPGSSEYYSTDTIFTTQVGEMVEDFDVVRFLWPVDGWNGPWQIEWGDRVNPNYCSFNRNIATYLDRDEYIGWAGTGIAWEYAIEFANEFDKDVWLVMPIAADDNYIRNLAELWKSNYTVPNGKIYWEYTNEATWDFAALTSPYLYSMGELDEIVSYDGETNGNVLMDRYYGKRATEMSMIWREVWGDDAMMTRIRPVLSGMKVADEELIYSLDFIHEYYGNANDENVEEPHPVNYFFYGAGPSFYTSHVPDEVDDDGYTDFDYEEMYVEESVCLANMYGLDRVAYEAGVWTNSTDYQLPRITEAMVDYHEMWESYGAGLIMYHATTGGEDGGTALGFTSDAYDGFETRKYEAMDILRGTTKESVSKAKLAPCTIEAADWSTTSTYWEHPEPSGIETTGSDSLNPPWHNYKGYLFRTASEGNYTVQLVTSSSADIEIMVDGEIVFRGDISSPGSDEILVNLDEGMHGIRIGKYDDGYFPYDSIIIREAN